MDVRLKTEEDTILDGEQSLIFLLRHGISTPFFAINLYNVTSSLSARGAEKRRTTARGLKQCNTIAFSRFSGKQEL